MSEFDNRCMNAF